MKVFWSWQSDHDGKIAHYFVRDALNDALNEISKELELEESARPQLDHDTKGEPGSPPIVETILRKIDEATIFVADVTPVGETSAGKSLQNCNVMIELGYAKKALSASRIILIANSHYYNGPDSLPFDLRHNRGPIRYDLAPLSDATTRAQVKQTFSRELKDAIRLVVGAVPTPAQEAPQPRLPGATVWFEPSHVFPHALTGNLLGTRLRSGSRAFLKVVPSGWPGNVRRAQLKPPSHGYIAVGSGKNGNWSPNGDGFLQYWFNSTHENIATANVISQWFIENGEIWTVWAQPSMKRDDIHVFFQVETLHNMFLTLEANVRELSRVKARGPFFVEAGLNGILDAKWNAPIGAGHSVALADKIIHSEMISGDRDSCLNFVYNFLEKITDIFGFETGVPREKISAYLSV